MSVDVSFTRRCPVQLSSANLEVIIDELLLQVTSTPGNDTDSDTNKERLRLGTAFGPYSGDGKGLKLRVTMRKRLQYAPSCTNAPQALKVG